MLHAEHNSVSIRGVRLCVLVGRWMDGGHTDIIEVHLKRALVEELTFAQKLTVIKKDGWGGWSKGLLTRPIKWISISFDEQNTNRSLGMIAFFIVLSSE